MIHHIIKFIWNRKRSLVWVFVEQTLVFGVLLFCFIFSVERISRQFSKGNINVNNISSITFTSIYKTYHLENESDEDRTKFKNLFEQIKGWQSVELVSINRMGSVPGIQNQTNDSVSFNNNQYSADIKFCDENFYKMFSPKLTEGEWFRDNYESDIPPALITQRLSNRIKLTGSAIGQSISYLGITYRIIGVVEAFKDRADEDPVAAIFLPVSTSTGSNRGWEYVVKYKSGKENEFSKTFFVEFYRNFPRDQYMPWLIDLKKLIGQVDFLNFSMLLYIFAIPTAFLLIFAFLGTFGVVWMQSKKRMNELGLRMALGCTSALLQRTIIFENLILTTFSMLPGLIVVANLYAFAPKGWEWIAAVGAAVVIMWLFAAFSAWYPARKAAKVMPVEALRN